MNIASQDSSNGATLDNAYNTADSIGGFSMFLSFDYASEGAWSSSDVSSLISKYASHSSQFKVNGQPLVSTFEGAGNAGDWAGIKSSTNCFFMPDWSSLGPQGFSAQVGNVDGAFNWNAWPVAPNKMTTDDDMSWKSTLGSKPYMMAISPWFYTNLPQWSKNWLWDGDGLWNDRWEQAIEVNPDYIEILTWNDFGESHYIGPVRSNGIPSGAERYVSSNSHEAWRELLPYYIAAYKSGNTTLPEIDQAKIVWAHKPNPSSSGSSGGTTGNAPYQAEVAPTTASPDNISLNVLVQYPATVQVQIGDNSPTTVYANTQGINHFSIPFNGQTGQVTYTLIRDGKTLMTAQGDTITSQCTDELVNWNAVVGSATVPLSAYS